MSLVSGTRLGPYEIVAPVGAGGMGEVYRARDTRLGRDVAVKVLPQAFASDTERLRRFEQEARAVAALSHPNILAVFDIGAHGDAPFLVAELLEGETLRERLKGGPLPVRKALDVAVQTADGAAAAHEKGIVHRDLKPANIFLTSDGRVKILDFGLAKLAEREQAGLSESQSPTRTVSPITQTEAGVVLGTAGYMSPEQVRGKTADARSDIFALGAVLYEMLSGQRAFEKESSADTMAAILKEEPPELSGEGKKFPAALDRIVRHCLEKNPAERFQSARDLAFQLESLSDLSTTKTAALVATSSVAARKRRLLFAAFGTVGLVLCSLGVYVLGRKTARTEPPAAFFPVSFRPEAVFNARFAPDGQTIVFGAAAEGNKPQLFIRQPNYPAPQAFGPADTELLSVSSKGELAVLGEARFVANRVFTGTLATMNLGGGAPREELQDVQEADWAPDGSGLAIIREVNGEDRLEYPVGKVLAKTSGYLSDLRFSPRGDRIAYFDHPLRYDDRGSLDLVDLEGHVTVLSPAHQALEGIAWAKNGSAIYFSSCCVDGAHDTVDVATLSGKTRTAVSGAGDLFTLDANSGGDLLVSENAFQYRVMASAPGAAHERDLSWLDSSYYPQLSPNGQSLLFSDTSEAAGGNYALLLRAIDGTPATRLGDGIAMGLSRDGAWALSMVPGPPARLVLYPTGAGEKRVLDAGPIVDYQTAEFVPDWARVLSCGNEKGQQERCYIQPINGGAPRPVTPPGTSDGFVSPDAKSVLVRDAEGGYVIYPIAGGAGRTVSGLGSEDTVIRWNPDGRSISVFRAADVPAQIESVALATGRRTRVGELAPADRTGVLRILNATISDDGKSYAYAYALFQSQLSVVKGVR